MCMRSFSESLIERRVEMKSTIMCCCTALAFLSTPAFAAEKSSRGVDKFLDKMKTELNLSAEQVEDIKPILKQYQTEIRDARKDREDDLEEVLTEDQMDKFKAMKEEKAEDISESLKAK